MVHRSGCLMNSYTAWSVIAAIALSLAGCAADELDSREAAYPESIGVTPPRERASSQASGASADPETSAPATEAPTVSAQSPSVVIGDGAESEPPYASADAPGGPPVGGAALGTAPPGAPPASPPPAGPPPGEPPPGEAASDGAYGDADPSALTDFRPSLDPYGTWTEDPTYGSVWVPSPDVVGDDFAPYASAGHWAYDDDYVWVSDYDWGWVPFHYGRWAYGPGIGWEWIPGRSYAGAWVSWRYGEGGYVGWAPLAPAWGWRGGVPVALRGVPGAPYAFVGTRDLFARSIGPRIVRGPLVPQLTAQTRPWTFPSGAGRPGMGDSRHVGGPPPALLSIAPSSVVHTTAGDRGVVQARAFARPSTAVALGGRAPEGSTSARVGGQYRGVWRPSTTLSGGNPSHFGGKLGVGFVGNPNAAGPLRSPAVLQGRPYFGSPGTPSRGFSRPTASPPVYRSSAPAPSRSGGGSGWGGSHGAGRASGGRGGGGRR